MLEKQIIADNKISSFFTKANLFLLNHNKKEFLSTDDKETLLNNLWFKNFKATLVKENNQYTKIRFQSEKDLTLFQLRFD